MTITKGYRFYLHVSIPDQLSRKVEVIDHISAGLDPRCDLVLIDKKIRNHHLLFEKKGPLLSVKLLVSDSPTFLNTRLMEKDHAYVIDQGDSIEVGNITITLSSVYGDLIPVPERSPFVQIPVMDEIASENKLELRDLPASEEKVIPKKVIRTKKRVQFLFLIKTLALILDFFLSYSIMLIIGLFTFLPLSLFVFFWLLRISTGLVFGKTPGEFILGLKSDKYSLQTRLAPVFFLSFLEQKKEQFIFRFMRSWGFLFLLYLIMCSPFFLPGSIQTPVSSVKVSTPQLKALQTFTVKGHSQDWNIGIKADVGVQYFLLPVFNKDKKAALSLFNVSSKKELQFLEVKSFKNSELYKLFHYANPLWKKNETLSLKEQVKTALTLSPLNIMPTLKEVGPFFGSSLLLKKEILDLMHSNEDVMINDRSSSLPLLILNNSNSELVLLFTKNQVIIFSVVGPKPYDHGLSEAFHHSVLTQFYWESEEPFWESSQGTDILRPFDEKEHGIITALLTYYSNEAKKLSKSNVINQSLGVQDAENKKSILKNVLSRLEKNPRDEIIAKSIKEINDLLNGEEKTNDRKSSGKKDVRPKSNTHPRSSKRTLQIQSRSRR